MKNQTKIFLSLLAIGVLVGVGALMMNTNAGNNYLDTPQTVQQEPQQERASLEKDEEEVMAMKKNLVETAQAAGSFNTLIAAIQAAGLEETIAGSGPFTVFAPTDEAFAKLPEGTVESLLEDKDQLTSILTYHVVSGTVPSTDVVNLDSAESLQGGKLAIKTDNSGVMINNAKVVQTDVEAENGIIHVIDTVLIPS